MHRPLAYYSAAIVGSIFLLAVNVADAKKDEGTSSMNGYSSVMSITDNPGFQGMAERVC